MSDKINVLMSGLPGNMATIAAKKIADSKDLGLIYTALTGEDQEPTCELDGFSIKLWPPEKHEDILKHWSGDCIVVDYTTPSAVNRNVDLYAKYNVPCVVGTTGGDKEKMENTIKNSEISAVIAPNMGKQIVGFQAMMAHAAENYPNLFKEYALEIIESHQEGKKDTSGTAKAMIKYFNELGVPFSKDQIVMIRDPKIQEHVLGVPKEYLTGHGYHTYKLKSPDGTVVFQFSHNVNGRGIYADGTPSAIRYLDKKIKDGSKGEVFSMIDVLKEGL